MTDEELIDQARRTPRQDYFLIHDMIPLATTESARDHLKGIMIEKKLREESFY